MVATKKGPDLARLKEAVEALSAEMTVIEQFGKAADHIAELGDLDVSRFGIAVVTADGDVVEAGESDHRFPIQSISKVFALTLALEAFGDEVWKRVGREPSGDPFNSIVDLERHEGIPRNPFINAGAIVVVDMLLDRKKDAPSVQDFVAAQIGDAKIEVDRAVYDRESASGFTNRAQANLAKAFGNLTHDVDKVMAPYVRQCAIALSCRELALAGRYLTLDGVDPKDEDDVERARRVRRVNAMMLTCGQYDGSGEFAYRVGLPAKSGVGGGILAIVPNIASIAVWSPGLDENGNSLLGTIALERLVERMDWSVFGAIRRR